MFTIDSSFLMEEAHNKINSRRVDSHELAKAIIENEKISERHIAMLLKGSAAIKEKCNDFEAENYDNKSTYVQMLYEVVLNWLTEDAVLNN